ncbi:PA-phosphatase [Mycolicibacterium hippocampi]|uniref:Phosphoesterase n=2 Tax=Mycolicibacterium hippocampi TaxID=659824 RepID=A0A7I9ZJM9_9MYCO|nr:PA-phosphatase [Mycolicibacterium hippocampi]GFH01174.1 phosphoesterase [Mycolicibacterium hippocampi]
MAGLAVMTLLGLAVGRGSTPVDDWFQDLGQTHRPLGWLLVFTDGRVTLTLWAILLAIVVLQKRWRLAAVVAVAPPVGVLLSRLAKRVFGREKEGALAYPSGHTTLAVVVFALAVLIAGVTVWAVVGAVVATVLAVLGQAVSYHYFTDAVGAVFLGAAVVSAAAWSARLDRCQPRCDLDHTSG